mmetsp:Transcript_36077/g.116143  ORF Transcript_36077/g.116143 Transcript_36077/m.116143 type:complete len:89 (-) Transcript_36077:14-280(-)
MPTSPPRGLPPVLAGDDSGMGSGRGAKGGSCEGSGGGSSERGAGKPPRGGAAAGGHGCAWGAAVRAGHCGDVRPRETCSVQLTQLTAV